MIEINTRSFHFLRLILSLTIYSSLGVWVHSCNFVALGELHYTLWGRTTEVAKNSPSIS